VFPLSNPIAAYRRWRANAAQRANGQPSNVVQFPGAGNTAVQNVTSEELIQRTMLEASQLTDVYEDPLDKAWHGLYALMSYLAPTIAALAAGWWIGDGYAGSFKWDGASAGVHIISIFGELALVALTLTSARIVKRAASDKSMWRYLAVTVAVLLIFSIASALAQWFLILSDVKAAGYDPSQAGVLAMLAFRVVMPVSIDIAALLYLSIHGHRSLKNKLAQIDERSEAFQKLHARMLEMQALEEKARQEAEDREAERERRRRTEETLNRIQEMQANAALNAIEKSLNPQIVDGSRNIRRG
jgi:hypothetical protein